MRKLIKVFTILTALTSLAWSMMTDHCPAGNRQTNIDNRNVNVFGTAQKVPLSISYYEGSDGGAGSVWLKRKVRIRPRLRVHLKVAINNLAKDQTDQERIIDGFAIVLSQNTNFLGGGLGGKPPLKFIYVFI